MKRFNYVEFTDKTAKTFSGAKRGLIYFVGDATDEIINELNLEKDEFSGRFYSTLTDIGRLGWQLKFVTPCALNYKVGAAATAGPIENSYIFEKEIEA